MRGGHALSSLPLNKKIDYHAALNLIRTREGFDFAGLAFYEQENQVSPIKWHYVSGNLNNRYKLIVLRKGKGLAGNVMKTGKRMIIEDVNQILLPSEKHKYPIVLTELLTAMVAIPLWYNRQVYGVLLLGQRDGNPLPIAHGDISIADVLGIFKEED